MLHPDLRMHQARGTHEDFLLHLLQLRVLLSDEEDRGGGFFEKRLHELEQGQRHRVMACEAFGSEHGGRGPGRSVGPKQGRGRADVQPDAVRVIRDGEEGGEHAHG